MRIALAGNPNSGKTTMYNSLTGAGEKVGNWAGVTVEKKERLVKKSLYVGDFELIAVDLPGAYSMSPFTSEESITSEYIRNARPDAIINIVDATNLSRSLFFTTQLLEVGIPVVIALNKSDVNKKKENRIDAEALSKLLGCPVVETVSTASVGICDALSAAIASVGRGQSAPYSDGNGDLRDRAAARDADRRRFRFVNGVIKRVETRKRLTSDKSAQDKIDAVLTNRWAGIPIFAAVMFAVFWISQAGPGIWLADLFVGLLEMGQDAVRSLLESGTGEINILGSILVDGIIGGVIAVVGFLPLVMVMYFLIALLEDSGYMARATVVLDPIFKRVGLSGKSVIPFVIGTGCAVPGVMACRTIKDERERRATAMLAPFMPCGAKLPVISLFAGAFFGRSALVGVSMYFVGILVILLGALLVRLLTGSKKKSYFIMEMPEYKLPSLTRAAFSMLQRGRSYIVKAGTIILVCNFAVHIMQSFNWRFEPIAAGAENTSILASLATPFAYIIAPLVGVVAWQLAAAVITGFIAKENVVGTLAVCYGIANFFDLEELEMVEGAGADVAAVFGITKVAALAFMMFNLFSPPCFAAIGAMRSELKSAKWLAAAVLLQLAVGYTLGFAVYFFGTLITGAGFGSAWMLSLGLITEGLIVAAVAYLIIMRKRRERV